jgi:hypothetical protein
MRGPELSADKPQTLDMLQKDASSLERALKDAGLNLSGGLAFSLKGDGRSQTWRDAQGGRSRSLNIAAADAASANAALTDARGTGARLRAADIAFGYQSLGAGNGCNLRNIGGEHESVSERAEEFVGEFRHLPLALDDTAQEPRPPLANGLQ